MDSHTADPASEVERLTQKIKSTNNGYIFAPSGDDVRTAKSNPLIFSYSNNGRPASDFPIRISLK